MRSFHAGVLVCTIASILLVTGCSQGSVKTGIDVLEESGFAALDGKRVGLVTNPTGVTRDLRTTIDVLHQAPNVELVALFGPEHGVRGDAYAGDKVDDSRDERTGVMIYSLYGKTREPTAEMLKDVDVLVFDIQDIGSRSYTYISTMAVTMAGAAKHGVPYMVLDRPNPLSGERMEGTILRDMKYRSYVSYLQIPYVHGLTVGELAQMINGEGWLPEGRKCDLQVIQMEGWKRSMTFPETGLQWVVSSPHVPRADTAMFYASTGIMGELRTISEGVGYTLPFEVCGAPGIDAGWLADNLNARNLPGVIFRPIYYKPYYTKYEKQLCGGVQVHIVDSRKVQLTPIQLHVMDAVRSKYPELKLFGNKRDKMFDKVCCTSDIREMFESGKPIDEILGRWNEDLSEFAKQRAPYLIYK